MEIPTDEQIRALHERFAPTRQAFDLVHTHCRIVCEVASQLLHNRESEFDVALVRAGALLHDIGVYRLAPGESYLRHGVLGHELLRSVGWPEHLQRFCSCHTGVGITREDIERQSLPLPPADYVPVTPEETLVMYADKFHSKTTPPVFVSASTYRASLTRFGPTKPTQFDTLTAEFGLPDLTALATQYGHAIT
ncbi:HD domain-containing protein [Actinoplanes sp. NPDC049596]|uniref:HD domain-containing protein n=1 Tax=unclassified Actinoplanes TaxID=2626549 RepID=UPI003443E43E